MFIIEDGVLTKYEGNDKSITIPEGVKRIGERAFSPMMSELEEVILPSTLETIGVYALFGLPIKTVRIPSSVKSIEFKAFHECCELSEIVLESGLEAIGEYAFCGNACKAIEIPNTVKEIGEYAFCDCRFLESVTIPNSVTRIGENAFSMNPFLREVSIPAWFKDDLFPIFKNIDSIHFTFI